MNIKLKGENMRVRILNKPILNYVLVFILCCLFLQYILQLTDLNIITIKNYLLQIFIILLVNLLIYRVLKNRENKLANHFGISILLLFQFLSIYPSDYAYYKYTFYVGFSLIGVFIFIFGATQIKKHKLDLGFIDLKIPTYVEILILCLVFILAILLRLYKLAELPTYVDELAQLSAARSMAEGNVIIYTRAYIILTVPLRIIFEIFDYNIFYARVYCIFINSLAIIPLFYSLKNINKLTAIFSIILFATSPWIIARAQLIREYAIAPLLTFLIVFFFIELLNKTKHKNIYILFLILIFLYIYFIEVSTYIILGTIYAGFISLLILTLLQKRVLSAKVVIYSTIGIIFAITTTIFVLIKIGTFYPIIYNLQQGDSHFIDNISNSSILQWYFNNQYGLWLIAIFASLFWIFVPKVRKIYLTFWGIFAVFAFAYLELIPGFSKTRHALYGELIYLIILSFGLSGIVFFIYRFINKQFKYSIFLYSIIIFALFANFSGIINFINSRNNITDPKGDASYFTHPVTKEVHFCYENIDEFFTRQKDTNGSILLSDHYGSYVDTQRTIQFLDSMFIHFNDPNQEYKLTNSIRFYKKGYYVVDEIRMAISTYKLKPGRSYCVINEPLEINTLNNKDICDKRLIYSGKYDSFYIWSWGD